MRSLCIEGIRYPALYPGVPGTVPLGTGHCTPGWTKMPHLGAAKDFGPCEAWSAAGAQFFTWHIFCARNYAVGKNQRKTRVKRGKLSPVAQIPVLRGMNSPSCVREAPCGSRVIWTLSYQAQGYCPHVYGYRTDNKKSPVENRFLNLSEILDLSQVFSCYPTLANAN